MAEPRGGRERATEGDPRRPRPRAGGGRAGGGRAGGGRADSPGPDSPGPDSRADARRPPGRRWWVGFAALVVVLVLAGWWTLTRPAPAGPAATPTPSPTPSIPEIARQQVWTSDTPSSGEYRSNTITLPPGVQTPEVVRYRVLVETTTELDADDVAREVQRTLDDPRGWAGYGRRAFMLVPDADDAALTIYIAAPGTADELCEPLDIESKWNCRVGSRVVLNSDRWKYMTPTYDDLGAYRAYLVNHEVGHFLGQGHVGCPKAGAPAPVMMQQSIELDGCTPNAWPKLAD